MQTNSLQRSPIVNLRVILAVALLSIGVAFGAAAPMWSVVRSPNGSVELPNSLGGIACVSSSDCWAVGHDGYYSSNGSLQTLIEHWDGTSWSIVGSPNPTAQYNFLYAVTCSSSSDCWTVGFAAGETLIEHWDGTAWSIARSPTNGILKGVTCASPSDCWAVGTYSNNFSHTLIEHWDGASWSIVSSPNASNTQDNFLNGVTCASLSDCWAVGNYFNGSVYQTLTEHWDGTAWSVVSSPNPSDSNANEITFNKVTCSSSSDCWAVGNYFNGSVYQTLIEHWDGTAWSVVSSPNNGASTANLLSAVTCASSSNCWAVGSYYTGSAVQTLTEHWDGTAWSIASSLNTSVTQDNYLTGVTCVPSSDCRAVGYYYNGSVYQTLIEYWDGTNWSVVISSNAGAPTGNFLNGMTCGPSSDCWAVGEYDNGSTVQTLIEHSDGTSWSIVSSPNTSATRGNILYGVTCASSSDCWAVGYYYGPDGLPTLIEHWDGPRGRLLARLTTGRPIISFTG
jgi:hypothetical protein